MKMPINVSQNGLKSDLKNNVEPGIERLYKVAYTHLPLCLSQNASCLEGAPTRDVFYTLQPLLGRHWAPKIDGSSRKVGCEAKERGSGKGKWEWETG